MLRLLKIRICMFLFVLFCGQNPLWSSDLDSTQERSFKKDFQTKYKDDVFQYILEDEQKNELKFDKPQVNVSSSLMQTIILITVILALAFILFLYFQGDGQWRIFKKEKLINTDGTLDTEAAFLSDHDIQIKEAEQAQDFTTATRFRFLKYLSTLNDRNIIRFHKEKTNLDYTKEITIENTKERFRQLAFIYDNVWYGKHALDADMYQKITTIFENAQKETAL